MVKICHVTSVHKRYDTRIFEKECISLAEAGYKVYLVLNDNEKDELVSGVNIISTGEVFSSRKMRLFKGAKEVYKKAVDINADLYHIHDPELLPYAIKLKKKGKYVIFDSHENYPLRLLDKDYIPKMLRKIIAQLYKIYETYICKRIDAVIFPCLYNNQNPFEGRAKRVALVDNCAKEILTTESSIELEEKIPNSVCYVGGLTEDRGISHLINAAYKAKAKLVLAGNFHPEGYKEYLEDQESFSIVDYRGVATRNEVFKIYKSCIIGASLLKIRGQFQDNDNLPTKVYEYMLMGLPIIVSKTTFAKKINEKYDCFLLVNPEDEEEISEAIKFLLENPDKAKRKGQAAKFAAETEFNWEKQADNLKKAYQEILL